MPRVCGALAAAIIFSFSFGCEATPRPDGPHARGQPTAAGSANEVQNNWPFRPREMRIHPLTRLAEDPSDGLVIEARLEFVDLHGHTTKALGEVRFLLSEAGRDEPLQHWRVIDLNTLALNKKHFDDVTRTYLFRLVLGEDGVSQTDLHVLFTAPDGREMLATHRLRPR